MIFQAFKDCYGAEAYHVINDGYIIGTVYAVEMDARSELAGKVELRYNNPANTEMVVSKIYPNGKAAVAALIAAKPRKTAINKI